MSTKERIFAVVMTVLANTCAGIATQHIFQDGSTTAKVVSVLGIISLNVLALVTKPVAGKGGDQ